MTSAAPDPQDDRSSDADLDDVSPASARGLTGPETPAAVAPGAKKPAKKSSSKRPAKTPKAAAAKKAAARPAPAVVPPLPSLPADVAAAAYAGGAPVMAAPEDEPAAWTEPEPAAVVVEAETEAVVVEAEPEVVEPEPESEVVDPTPEPEVVEPEPEAPDESAPHTAVLPEPEPEVTEPEPVTAVLASSESAAETAVLAEPAAAVSAEPATAVLSAPVTDTGVVDAPDVDGVAGGDETSWALRLHGLTKTYGDTRAVESLDLEIPVGSFYGLVGPNGAGKTTTLSMIAGLLRPDRGTVEIAGIDLGRDPTAAKRQMGVLPDRLRTFDRLSGRQLLYYYGVLRGLKPSVVEDRIADLARAFDLTDALARSVSDYSAGMTKKVMLAGAMIHSPRLLVLDEPFESVDPVSSAVILDILRAYVDHGGTVVLSSHGMDLVQRACSGVAVLVGGRVLASGTVDEVRAGRTLEERFLELAGGTSAVEGLEWLHTFSD